MTTPADYNATALTYDASSRLISSEAVLFEDGRVLHACGLWTGSEDGYQALWLLAQSPGVVRILPSVEFHLAHLRAPRVALSAKRAAALSIGSFEVSA